MVVLNLKRFAEDFKIAEESGDVESSTQLKDKLKSFIQRKEHMRTDIVKFLKNNKHIQSTMSCLKFVETL